jgi:hypothetical protein
VLVGSSTCIVYVNDKQVIVVEVQLVSRIPVALVRISINDHDFCDLTLSGESHSPGSKCDVTVRTPALTWHRNTLLEDRMCHTLLKALSHDHEGPLPRCPSPPHIQQMLATIKLACRHIMQPLSVASHPQQHRTHARSSSVRADSAGPDTENRMSSWMQQQHIRVMWVAPSLKEAW